MEPFCVNLQIYSNLKELQEQNYTKTGDPQAGSFRGTLIPQKNTMISMIASGKIKQDIPSVFWKSCLQFLGFNEKNQKF
jgi:hypothetical protein